MPAVRGGVGEAEDEAEHPGGLQQHAGNVQLELGTGCLSIEQDESAHERHAGEDEVRVERPTPLISHVTIEVEVHDNLQWK